MKKILIFFMGLLFLSCTNEFLDQVPDDKLTFEETFSKRSTAEQYLANVYSQIPNEMAQRYTLTQNSGPWTGASDEAEYVWSFHMGNFLNMGDWNATTQEVSTLWSNMYRGIRAASTFILNIEKCKDCSPEITAQYKAEARVLRAYFYYNLVRSWGPVIIIGDGPIAPDADLSTIRLERNTMQENVDYIVSELDKAAAVLKRIPFRGGNAGRMSRPFAMLIKEKTLLFAASPLFNGNTDAADMKNSEGVPLISQTVDKGKWKLAADAAKAFIDEYVPTTFELYKEYRPNGSIDPYLSTRNVMLEEWNSEIIYARPRGDNYYAYDVTPYHSGAANEVRGAGGLGATQEMVDAYFMNNGRSIDDPASEYMEEGFSEFKAPYDFKERSTYNQWVNREPRFYVGITYNNSLWLNRDYGDIITETWYDGNSGRHIGGNDYSKTGYIVRKNMPAEVTGDRSFVKYRLAGVFLDYIEALNEYSPGHPDILLYLNKIRERAGIPGYGSENLPAPQGQDGMRVAIRKERRVELAFENVRYFDVRRWKLATELFGGPMHGLDVNAREEENFYNVVVFETRIFNKRHYLWPIPQDEMNANPKLIQNPGW